MKPLSASVVNSMTSSFGRFIAQSAPRVPHRTPDARMVPLLGLVIVSSSPDGRNHDTINITSAPSTMTPMTAAAPIVAPRYRTQNGPVALEDDEYRCPDCARGFRVRPPRCQSDRTRANGDGDGADADTPRLA